MQRIPGVNVNNYYIENGHVGSINEVEWLRGVCMRATSQRLP